MYSFIIRNLHTISIIQFQLIEYSVKEDLIPRSRDSKCTENAQFKDGLGTCSCEDHCGWDVCRLIKAPIECISGSSSEWQWDSVKNGWVAQVILGNVT